MTNSINKMNKMAGKQSSERTPNSAGPQQSKSRSRRVGGVTTPPRFVAFQQQRHSPAQDVGGRGSPRSPGQQLFAGAKWTEPPAATALPPPPVHWMQQSKHVTDALWLAGCGRAEAPSAHLQAARKLLLKIQA